MLLKRLRETSPDVIFLIFIILIATWIAGFIHPDLPSDQSYDTKPMPLFGLLLAVTSFSPLFSVVVAFLLVLLISFLLVNFNTNIFFISERTFLPAIIYILITGFFPQYQVLNPLLPATVFLILGIRKIMDSYKVQGIAFSFYDAGMLISTGALFYASFIWFGFLLLVGTAILRTFKIKEIILSILGLATPAFLLYGFFYVAGKDMTSLQSAVTFNLFTKEIHHNISGITIAALLITAAITLLSVAHLLSVINAKKIKSRKTFILLFWTFIIAAGIFISFKTVSVEIFWLAAIPVCYFITHYLVFARKKIIPEIMLAILFVLTAILQLTYLFK